jgi:predicted acyl esterase
MHAANAAMLASHFGFLCLLLMLSFPARPVPGTDSPRRHQCRLDRRALHEVRAPHPDLKPNLAYVAMGGYQQLVRGDVFRGKFRNSFEKPEPFKPGELAKIEFEIPDICHTFRRGHRVMVHVQSTWFPLVDRNPQTFVNIPTAKPENFQKATHRFYRGGKAASSLTVRVLPAGAK